MLTLIVTLICPALDMKYPFWANLIKKNKKCMLKMKFGSQTDYTE